MTARKAMLDSLIASAPMGIAILDLDMRFLEINETLATMNGVPAADHIGRSVAEVVPHLIDGLRPMFEQVIEAGSKPITFNLTGETRASPGLIRHWRETWFQIRVEGELRAVGVFVEEITDLKRTLEQLERVQEAERRRAEELQTLMEAAPAAIWIADDRACTRITGNPESYSLVEMAGGNVSATAPDGARSERNFQEFQDGKPAAPNELPMQRAAATGKPVRGAEVALVFKDGHVRHIYGNASPLRDAGGAVRGAVSVFIDVTERKQAEEALRAADQRKNEFIATLAHELRNPLSPIRNAATILRAVREDAASHDKAVDMIDRQVTHMARLLDDLLDVARITNNKLKLQLQPVQVREAVDHALEAVQPIASTRRHRMHVMGPPKPLTVLADPVRLTQIFVNLLTNAAKYTPDDGMITLAISQDDGQAVIEVRDNGIGIAPEQIQNLFQLFSRVYTEPDIREGGLGIGLSLVKLLVEAQGGTVKATSSGIGQGSVFTVRLPLTEQAEESKTQQATGLGHSITPCRRVLVVDDNMDAAESMATLLRLKGHEVHVAYDGVRAVELAAALRPNVVFLDLGLPGLNGAEVGRLIKTAMKDKAPRLIAVTGWGDVGDRRRTADAGFDLHLTKPIDPNALDALL